MADNDNIRSKMGEFFGFKAIVTEAERKRYRLSDSSSRSYCGYLSDMLSAELTKRFKCQSEPGVQTEFQKRLWSTLMTEPTLTGPDDNHGVAFEEEETASSETNCPLTASFASHLRVLINPLMRDPAAQLGWAVTGHYSRGSTKEPYAFDIASPGSSSVAVTVMYYSPDTPKSSLTMELFDECRYNDLYKQDREQTVTRRAEPKEGDQEQNSQEPNFYDTLLRGSDWKRFCR